MPVNLSMVKNLFIGLLALFAVYQTSQLWFDETAGHNFFYRFTQNEAQITDAELYRSFSYPYRLITGLGDNRFIINYSDMEERQSRNLGDEILALAVKSGEYISQSAIDWDKVLSPRAIIYEYSFPMPAEFFTVNFPERRELLSSHISSFDTVVISADVLSSNLLRLFFVNSAENISVEINLNNMNLCDELRKNIQDTQKGFTDTGIYYISTKLLHMETPSNQFIPRWRQEGYSYFGGITAAPYYDSEFDKARIRENLMSFFDNPSAVWDSSDEDISFSDENTVVRYLYNDILEYTNYRVNEYVQDTTVMDDYVTALKFISQRDTLMDNEIYLAGYEDSGEYRYLHFNYVAGDFPVILSDQILTNTDDLRHGVTVTFRNGNLISYKRLAYSFEINVTDILKASGNYLELIAANEVEPKEINGISYGYNAGIRDPYNGDLQIMLAIELTINGQRLILSY